MTEMRKDRRAPASLKVKYKSASVDEFIEQFGTDLSRGGIFIKTKKPLEAGALLKFEFQLQDGSAVLHGVGRVAWRRLEQPGRADLPAGMGIKFVKLSDHSRVVVERIESRYSGNKSRYDHSDAAEFAPPLSGQPPSGASSAKPLPGNGRRGLGGGSGPLTMPPPPAFSSIPPALADVPAARPLAPPQRSVSRPLGGSGSPKTAVSAFFPDNSPRTSGSPANAFQADGVGPEVRSRARAQAERARHDPESVDLARELFGDLGEGSAAQPRDNRSGDTWAGGVAAPTGSSTLHEPSPAPDAYSISSPVPAVELPRSAASRSSNPSLADRIPSIEQLVEDAGQPEAASPSQRSNTRASLRAPETSQRPRSGSQPTAARQSGGAVLDAPLTLAISVPTSSSPAGASIETGGRSRVLLLAALATTITLGGVAVYVGMQRGVVGSAHNDAAGELNPEPGVPSHAAEPAAPAAEPVPPTLAEPTRVAGPDVPVTIQSQPRGAEVSIAGKAHGATPLTIPLPSNVPIEIRVQRPGYAALTRVVTPREALPPESFELTPLAYRLVVVTEPAGATIAALGRNVVSPAPLELGHLESTVVIRVEKDGFQRTSRVLRPDEFSEQAGVMSAEIVLPLAPLPAVRRRAPVRPAEVTPAPTDAPPAPSDTSADPPVMRIVPQMEAPPEPSPPSAPEGTEPARAADPPALPPLPEP